jgi:hypothetical protein
VVHVNFFVVADFTHVSDLPATDAVAPAVAHGDPTLGAAAALAKVPKVMEVAGTSAESTTRAVAPIRRRELIKRFFTISPRIFGWLGFNGWDSMAGIQ